MFHAPLVAAVDGLEVAALLTRSPERIAHARAQHPGAAIVASVDELIGEVDVVVVATPNRLHREVALAALERGLHVVVDKPLAVTVQDARAVVDAGGERLTVFQNRRWDGDFMTLRREIDSGRLGHVFRMESRFERFRPEVTSERWRELADPAEGGGLLLDLGSHLVDQALVLFGPAQHVYAELHARRPGAQVEDDVFVALEHAGGVRSHLWMSATAPLFGPRFRVSGLRAGFAADGLDPQEDQLREGMHPGDPGFGAAPGLEPGRYVEFYEGVRDWVAGAAAPPVDPRDSLAGLEVLAAARRSAAERQLVSLR